MAHVGNKNALKHGGRHDPAYGVWIDMRRRCEKPDHPAYQWYGARGITVCDRWASFVAFKEDMGERPGGASIDRIDNAKGYEPNNCRWATQLEQQNNRRGLRKLTHDGRTQTLEAWAREAGLGQSTLHYRLSAGWPLDEALTTKPRQRNARI